MNDLVSTISLHYGSAQAFITRHAVPHYRQILSASGIRSGVCMLALAVGLAGHVQAQDVEEITVTGSRISRTTMETPTPMTIMSSDELSAMAPGNLSDSLAQMPLFYGNTNVEQVNGGQNSGGSNVNLRGVGTNRTLTLLDGRRVVPTNRFGTVDVNLFPEDLLRSVETVTGGASASYGTDAVAGVVNFLLDTDFEGFKVKAQTGMTRYGDGENWEAGASFGTALTDRWHVIGSLTAFEQARIGDFDGLADRTFLRQEARVTNPDATGPTDLNRPFVSPTNYTETGVFVEPSRPLLNRMVFNPDGTVSPMYFTGVGSLNAGCQCQAELTQSYGVNNDAEVLGAFDRINAFLYTDYDLSDNTNIYFQGIWADNRTKDRRESIPLLSIWGGRIYSDNVFLHDQVRNLMTQSNVTFANFGIKLPNDGSTILGESRQFTENSMESYTVGFNTELTGGFLDGWSLEGYYQRGENQQDFNCINCVRVDRLFLAMDAVADPVTGSPVCRVNLPQFTGPIAAGGNGGLFADCSPINLLGGAGNISKSASNYVMDRDDKVASQWTDQDFAEVVLSGDVWEGFGAGPVAAAFGASYRKESMDQRTVDASDEYPAQVNGTLMSAQGLIPDTLRGLVPQGENGGIAGYNGIAGLRFVPTGFKGDSNSSTVLFSSLRDFGGSYNVKEIFAELNIPLLSGAALADYMELTTAARWADYSGSGEIWAWKVGFNWTLTDEWRVRATASRDVRAATLRERFDQTRGGVNVRNPWDNDLVVSAASLSGGNPNVAPEESDTLTAGIIYQPEWLPGYSVSLDWYDTEIQGAIGTITSQNVVDGCRGGDLSLCQYVVTPSGPVTDPNTTARLNIERVEAVFLNLDKLNASGADMEMAYVTDVDFFGSQPQSLRWRFLSSWLEENSRTTSGGFYDDLTGEIGGVALPDFKITTSVTYTYGPYSAFLQGRWIDGGVQDRTRLESSTAVPASQRPAGSNLALCAGGAQICTVDDNTVPSIFYVDARIGGYMDQDERLEVFANINNLLDRKPHILPTAPGRLGVGLGVNSIYDILGRSFTVGMNYRM